MKRKVSFAFVIMCVITLLSLGNIVGIFSSVLSIFRRFSLLYTLRTLCSIVSILTPVAIAVLLYFNTKQDIKSKAVIVLVVCGCAALIGALLNYNSLLSKISALSTSSWFEVFLPFFGDLSSIARGALLIAAAFSIKQGKTTGAVKGLGFVGIWIGVLLLVGSIFPGLSPLSRMSFVSSLKVLLLAIGLWCLPKTICDYENCFYFGENAKKLMIALAVVVVFIILVSTSLTDSGSSSRKDECAVCGGSGLVNTGFIDFKTCPVCKGSGIDFH